MRPLTNFRGQLALIAAAAFAVRLLHVLLVAPATSGIEDAFWFSQVAHSIAQGDGFTVFNGSVFAQHIDLRATASHPPLYPLLLAIPVKLGIASDEALRSLGVLFGTLTVVLVGLLGRRVAGDRVGLGAALIAAAYPLLIAADGALLAETLYAPIIAATLLVALKTARDRSLRNAAGLGALMGLAILTRSESVLLLPLVLAPVAWAARGRRAALTVAALAAAALVVAPWVVRNTATFGKPLLTTNGGGVVAQANCGRAYHGYDLGYLVPERLPRGRPGDDEAQNDARARDRGLAYASDHAARIPVVAGVRALRAWAFWQPFRGATEQGRSANVMKLGIVLYYPLLALGVLGAVELRRRRLELLVLLAPVALATLTAMAGYGSIRLRLPADVSLTVLAAVGLARLTRLLQYRAAT